MAERADAHIHLFEQAFRASFASRPGVQLNEAACYESLMADHDVIAALIVAYTGDACYAGNNEYLARIKPQHDWMHPVACVEPTDPPTIAQLQQWRNQGFMREGRDSPVPLVRPVSMIPSGSACFWPSPAWLSLSVPSTLRIWHGA